MTPWNFFFPEGTPVVAIPGWERPRLYVAGCPRALRWRASALFPAYRPAARVRRVILRCLAQLSLRPRRGEGPYLLGALVRDAGGGLTPSAVLVGTPGPAQKLTVQLVDGKGRVAAYLKYGESPAAVRRLEREHAVLRRLPRDAGPAVLAFGHVGRGVGLLLTALSGRPLAARIWPPSGAVAYIKGLVTGAEEVPAADHPWLRRLASCEPIAARWCEALDFRRWQVVPEHGDFAPWNVLHDGRQVHALDWEYGSLEGFPGADLAHYVLQAAALLGRWPPEAARACAVRFLRDVPWLRLGEREAEALVRLTALAAYRRALEDGHAPSEPLQAWRRRVAEAP